MRGDQRVHLLAQVVPQVPPVGHLPGVGCTLTGSVGVAAGAVPADHLDAGVDAQPVGELHGALPVQDVHRPVPVAEVDQHRAVLTPASPREFVDTEDRHRPDGRVGQAADPAQQRRPADRHAQRGRQSRAGPPGQRQRDGDQRILRPGGALGMPLGQTRDLLDERARTAIVLIAEEPAHPKAQLRPLTGDR